MLRPRRLCRFSGCGWLGVWLPVYPQPYPLTCGNSTIRLLSGRWERPVLSRGRQPCCPADPRESAPTPEGGIRGLRLVPTDSKRGFLTVRMTVKGQPQRPHSPQSPPYTNHTHESRIGQLFPQNELRNPGRVVSILRAPFFSTVGETGRNPVTPSSRRGSAAFYVRLATRLTTITTRMTTPAQMIARFCI